MEPRNGKLNTQLGLIVYSNYDLSGAADLTFGTDDAVIIKDQDANNKLKISLECGELVFQYPSCEGWNSQKYKLTSQFFQETSILNLAGNHCLNIDCEGVLRNLRNQFQTGPFIELGCNDTIRLRKGLYRFMMTGEIRYQSDCSESYTNIYPAIKIGCDFREPKESYQLQFKKDPTHNDQYVQSTAIFYMNCNCNQIIKFFVEGERNIDFHHLSVAIEYVGLQHQDIIDQSETDMF